MKKQLAPSTVARALDFRQRELKAGKSVWTKEDIRLVKNAARICWKQHKVNAVINGSLTFPSGS